MDRPPPISLKDAEELMGKEGLLKTIEAVEEKLTKDEVDY